MKKLLIYSGVCLFLSSLFFVSCKNEVDDVWDTPANTRLQQRLDECKAVLTDAQYGWKLDYRLLDEYDFSILMDFTADNRVEMLSDFVGDRLTSTYSLNAGEGPVLTFDTYSLLTILADPAYMNAGEGYKGDFEFKLTDIDLQSQQDSIVFKGRRNGDRVVFRKATQQEWQIYGNSANLINLMSYSKEKKFFRCLHAGSRTIDLFYDINDRTMSFRVGNGATSVKVIPIEFTTTGFKLTEPLAVFGHTFSEFVWDETKNTFVADGCEISDAAQLTYSQGDMFTPLKGGFFVMEKACDRIQDMLTRATRAVPQFQHFQFYCEYSGGGDTPMNMIALYSVVNGEQHWDELLISGYKKIRDDQYALQFGGIGEDSDRSFINKVSNAITEDKKWITNLFFNSTGYTIVPATKDVYSRNGGNFYLVSITDSNDWVYFVKYN